MSACNTCGENCRGSRLHGNNLDVGILRFQILTDTGNGAAGTNTGYKSVDCAVGILPDLRAGGAAVDRRIGGIDKLTRHKAVGDLPCQFLRPCDGTLHALGALRQHKFGPVGLHQLAALYRHGLRHNDDDAVAPCGCNGGKADAGVAAGRLDDDRAFLQQATFLGVVNHGLGNAILDRTGRVEVLQLGKDPGLEAKALFNMGQLQQRRTADELVSRSKNSFRHLKNLLTVILRLQSRVQGRR